LCNFCFFCVGEKVGKIPKETKSSTMVVFVHGTVASYLSIGSFFSWAKDIFSKKKGDAVAGSGNFFEDYIEKIKKHGIYKYQPIDERGLHPISLNETISKKDIQYFGFQTAKFFKKVHDLTHNNLTHHDNGEFFFYSYNWSGKLSKSARSKSAVDLYEKLICESSKISKQIGQPIKIYLVGHSHATNVILNLVKEHEKRKKESTQKLLIDKAIFFGGPVQSETEPYINNDLIKKIYHVWSKGDVVQVADFISTKDFFSRRIFGKNKKNLVSLPTNLYQIKIDFKSFNPSHYELYLWGKKKFPHFMYRKNFPIYPLPVSVLTPLIIAFADSIDSAKDKLRRCSLSVDAKKGAQPPVCEFLLTCAGQKVAKNIDIEALKKEALGVI
jgi:hypothetical protein